MSTREIELLFRQIQPNYLWFITLSYTMVIVLANWFDPVLLIFLE